jgi:Tol biopolymer transport system component
MTQTFGATTAPTAVRNDCTACHSLSRAGSRLGYSRCVAGTCDNEWVGFVKYDPIAKQWVDTVDANNKQINGSYTTFSPIGNPFPDDTKALAMVTMAGGHLTLYDPDTGTPIASNLDDVSTHGPGAPRAALMPDWSPDGKTIVFASTPHAGQWIDLSDSAIATMTYQRTGGQDVFGEPTMLVSNPITLPGGVYESFFFPSFSPDGQLIVFNAARASWRNFSDAKTAGQRLMLASATGAWTVDLTQMNGGTGDLDITWPHWAPGQTSDYYWVVFASERDYGHEATAATSAGTPCVANGVKQCKQIWIGAIAKNKLTGTVDPSAPPMWLPGQDTKTDNISPYWTVPTTEVQ